MPPPPLRRELSRKAIHLATAAVPVAYAAEVPRAWLAWGLGALCAMAVAAEAARARHAGTGALVRRTVGTILRDHERDRWTGATWLAIAHLTAVLLLPRDIAIAAMWGVSVGDAAAAVVGRALGRTRLGGAAKSIEGAAACFLATLAGAVAVARLPASEALVAAAAATVGEWPGRPLDDNVRIVLAVGGALLLWRLLG